MYALLINGVIATACIDTSYCICEGSNGKDYYGHLNTTVKGLACIDWRTKGGEYEEWEENYCRNTSEAGEKPWCFTSDGSWDYCDVPVCGCEGMNPNECGCKRVKYADYRGDLDVTRSGTKCIGWSDPRFHFNTTQEHSANEGLEGNYCRNPFTSGDKLWCYTAISPAISWAYCDSPICKVSDNCKNFDSNKCGCKYNNQEFYRGIENRTKSGGRCQMWSEYEPVMHNYGVVERMKYDMEENHCRNPGGEGEGPWCYLADWNGVGSKWEYCDIDPCDVLTTSTTRPPIGNCEGFDSKSCGCESDNYAGYRGIINVTQSGHKCQQWSSQEPNLHMYMPDRAMYKLDGLDNNYCRNPGGSAKRPWCYLADYKPGMDRWDYCDIPACESNRNRDKVEDCQNFDESVCGCVTNYLREYRGPVNTTEDGELCQRWDSQFPIIHKFTPENYPDDGLDGNYCRNPGKSGRRPWCYKGEWQKGQKWGYCKIAECDHHRYSERELDRMDIVNPSPIDGDEMAEGLETPVDFYYSRRFQIQIFDYVFSGISVAISPGGQEMYSYNMYNDKYLGVGYTLFDDRKSTGNVQLLKDSDVYSYEDKFNMYSSINGGVQWLSDDKLIIYYHGMPITESYISTWVSSIAYCQVRGLRTRCSLNEVTEYDRHMPYDLQIVQFSDGSLGHTYSHSGEKSAIYKLLASGGSNFSRPITILDLKVKRSTLVTTNFQLTYVATAIKGKMVYMVDFSRYGENIRTQQLPNVDKYGFCADSEQKNSILVYNEVGGRDMYISYYKNGKKTKNAKINKTIKGQVIIITARPIPNTSEIVIAYGLKMAEDRYNLYYQIIDGESNTVEGPYYLQTNKKRVTLLDLAISETGKMILAVQADKTGIIRLNRGIKLSDLENGSEVGSVFSVIGGKDSIIDTSSGGRGYTYILKNYNDEFEIDRNTGVLTVRDATKLAAIEYSLLVRVTMDSRGTEKNISVRIEQ